MRKYYATINEYDQPAIIEFEAEEEEFYYLVLSKKPLLNNAHLERKFGKLYSNDVFDNLDKAVEHLTRLYKHRIKLTENELKQYKDYVTELELYHR